MPVYHPTHEEVLRRGLRRALKATALDATELDAIRCADAPVACDTG
jgi:dihydrolipoamide dehydrogenase